ncbi:MAG TPA: zinc metalloprotease, partial [Bacteroidia bacterium]|nr:zinc metalloprotease [Bacteroidia bacterium]
MKNYLRIGSLLTLLLLQLTVSAQQRVRCFTEEHKTYLRTKQPKLDEQLRQARAKAEQWAAAHPDWRNESGGLMTIPVIVHVVYNTTGQNISDAQVESQIDVLNEDFARLNADTANTPAPFASIAGPTPIRFCLAQRTP